MIITFLGHSSLHGYNNLKKNIEDIILHKTSINDSILFYCGGYGDFDSLCLTACHSIKQVRKNCEIAFVTPYITESQQKKMQQLLDSKAYDSIIYPPLESVPFRFAISKRNEWMIDKSDLIIAFVEHSYGGAYKGLKYALRRKKRIINLAGTANKI